jgi:hypothetical protein
VPRGVGGDGGVGVGGYEPEERGGHPTRAGHPVRVAEHRDLLDVRDLADVDLLRELAQHRPLHVLVVAQQAAGEGPAALVGREGALPQEHLEGAGADLEHGRQYLVLGAAAHGRRS